MSKLKINDKVIVKESGKTGVVKGRDIVELPDGKVRVEYIVKTGNGFENWGTFKKNELERVVSVKTEKAVPTLVVDAPNGYKVTLVAIIRNETVWKDSFDENGYYSPYARKGKDLRIGVAFYNPNDTYDYDFGVSIATHRAKTSPFCHLISDFNGEFNKETIDALLKVKGEYIVNNIEHFVTK
jgi:hypothetical protein